MNVYSDENIARHIVIDFFKKITNCQYNFHILSNQVIKENSLFLSLGSDFLDNQDIELIENIKKIKNKSLFILHIGKCINYDTILQFKTVIEKYNFNLDKVYITGQLTFDFDSIQKILPNVNLFAYDQWVYELFATTLLPTFFKPKTFINYSNPLKHKKFSILCKRYTPDRLHVFCNLLESNLLESFNYTFVADRLEDIPNIIDKIKQDAICKFNNQELIYKWIEKIPYELPEVKEKRLDHYIYELEFYYESSSINISLETHPTGSSYLTEKTYRAIFYKKPFILISQYCALEALKADGYRTFSPFIDESYDKIEDYDLRLEAVIKEIKRLNSLPESEFNIILEQCKEITEHNYTNLLNYYFRPIPEYFTLANMLTFK